jgi:hypothetical protein
MECNLIPAVYVQGNRIPVLPIETVLQILVCMPFTACRMVTAMRGFPQVAKPNGFLSG